ncbi:MAG: hypothetical protein K2X11_17760 [Acetobacteraceae bacterium]|nr:hypothetical protein [Acetobacteraceae bacterium]
MAKPRMETRHVPAPETPAETRVRSAVPGIAWPAIPAANGAAMLALLFQMEQSQWWPPARLRARQRDQLAALLAHAAARVPFYRGRVPPDLPEGADWEEAWRRIPVLSRDEIQAADATEALLAEELPPGHGEWREIHTSGSTGRPVRSVRSQLWELIWHGFTLRDHLWHRRDLGGRLAAIRESGAGKATWPDGSAAPSWGLASDAVFATGPLVSLNVLTPVAQQAEWLLRQDPDYLLTHPSIARRLAAECLARGVRPARLRQVITIAETLAPDVRGACAEAWGAKVADIYSAREAGYLALQCPDHPHHHVQAEGVFLEVLRDDGTPCAPGEVGRVVVTPLHNLAMPLIRYDIGDAAEVGPPCPCGRGLPVLRRILGRVQDMLILPGGERRWPLLSSSDLAALLAAAPGLRAHQLVQTALDRLELRVEVAHPLAPREAAALADWARARFGERFAVTVREVAGLPRSDAGKFRDFVCEAAP